MNRTPLVFAAGVLAGAGLAAAFVRTAQTAAPLPDDALSRRLDAIESDLRFFSTAATERPPQLPAPYVDASPSPLVDARLDDILLRLDALQAQVGELSKPGGASAAGWAGAGATAADAFAAGIDDAAESEAKAPAQRRTVEPLPDALPEDPPNFPAFAALSGLDMDALTQRHQLWSYEKVGEAYGRPTHVYPSRNGVGIKYRYVLADGREFYFTFTDGKAINAFWDE